MVSSTVTDKVTLPKVRIKAPKPAAAPTPEVKNLTADQVATVKALAAARKAKAAAEATENEAKATIKDFMGAAVEGRVMGAAIVKISPRSRENASVKRIKDEFPAIFATLVAAKIITESDYSIIEVA